MKVQPHTQSLVGYRSSDTPEGKIASKMIAATDLREQDVAQLQTDITAFPTNWLKRFQERYVAVAVLKDNQSLADTPYLIPLKAEGIEEIVQRTGPLVQSALQEVMGPILAIEDPGEREYMLRMSSDSLQETLHATSSKELLGFALELGRDEQNLVHLAEKHGFDPEYDPESYQTWKSAFLQVNQTLVEQEGDLIRPKYGFSVLPYVMHRGKPVRALTLPDLKAITGLQFQNHHGANYPENRLVILHESVVANPSPVMGHHRVALHELGHMVDWICKELPQTKDSHETRVSQLYTIARQRHDPKAPEQSPFLTPRAADSPGEMMAEAVEAYLTRPEQSAAGSRYKSENHRENLALRFPELNEYVEYLMHLE